jgi:integrase
MRRTGESIQWRSRMRTWVGRITEWQDDGRRLRSTWTDLGTDNRDHAQAAYDRWVATGEPPCEKGRELFEVAAKRVLDAEEKALREIGKTPDFGDRRQRLRDYALPSMGRIEVARVEPHHVASVLVEMAKLGKSKRTLLKMRSDLSVLLSALKSEGARQSNPALGVDLPSIAMMDGRERLILSDEEIVLFRERRGFETEIDMAALLARDVGGERVSDALAHDWADVNWTTRTLKVRRPKTDGETGKKVSSRKVRAYELVDHGIPETVMVPLERWWKKHGSPSRGPIFPLRRDGVVGTVTLSDGRTYERGGGKAGERKAKQGNSFAEPYRDAVWEARIYRPLPGFDPAAPQRQRCAYQTDTDSTLRLDFQGLRGTFLTALSEAGVDQQTMLAMSGHTQATTQTRHYMKRRRVETPTAALPGQRPTGPAQPAATLDAVMAELGRMRAALSGVGSGNKGLAESGVSPAPTAASEPTPATPASAPGLPQKTGSAPRFGADGHLSTGPVDANSLKSFASPRGIEPLTSALGMHGWAHDTSQTTANSLVEEPVGTPRNPMLPHETGQAFDDPIALMRAAAAAAVMRGNWTLADQLRALITTATDNVRTLDAARRRKP